jgi:hypothetical protein
MQQWIYMLKPTRLEMLTEGFHARGRGDCFQAFRLSQRSDRERNYDSDGADAK